MQITKADLKPVEKQYKFPRGAYRGEFRDRDGHFVGNIYVVDHKAFIANTREYGRGEIVEQYPEPLDTKLFTKAGGYQLYASTWVQFWTLKEDASLSDANRSMDSIRAAFAR